mmetsp:Transcript_19443/g.22647  ORF Transcript_19443/g.22647 Transcript_19443/m.22647 type:complete len:149 (+) Transcript_19443:1215-1661(+)
MSNYFLTQQKPLQNSTREQSLGVKRPASFQLSRNQYINTDETEYYKRNEHDLTNHVLQISQSPKYPVRYENPLHNSLNELRIPSTTKPISHFKIKLQMSKGAAGLSTSNISKQISSKRTKNEYGLLLGQRPPPSSAKGLFRQPNLLLL